MIRGVFMKFFLCVGLYTDFIRSDSEILDINKSLITAGYVEVRIY